MPKRHFLRRAGTIELMLPFIKETIPEDDELGELGIHTIITSDWKEILDDKTFGFYKYQQRHD